MDTVFVVLLLVVAVVVTALLTRLVTKVEPEKKVFGLDQLRGAKRYGVQTAEHMRMVLAVFCGVANYHNTVAEDVQKIVRSQDHDIQRRNELITEDENEINELRAQITNLLANNKRSNEVIAEAEADLLLVQDVS